MLTKEEKDERSLRRHFWIRGAWAAPFLGVGALLLATGSPIAFLPAIALIVTGAIIISDPLARAAAGPLDRLFYPSRELEKPLPPYASAEAKVKKGEYAEAMEAYQRIALEYPGEIEPFIAMLHIAIFSLHDLARAAQVYEDGLRSLEREEQRLSLQRVYEAFRSTTEPKPEWQQARTVKFEPKPRPKRAPR